MSLCGSKRERRKRRSTERTFVFFLLTRKRERSSSFSPLSSFFAGPFRFFSAPRFPPLVVGGEVRPKKRKRKRRFSHQSSARILGRRERPTKKIDEKSSITPASSALTLSPSKSLSFFVGIYNRRGRARARLSIIYFLYSDRESVDSTDNFFFPERKALRAFPPKRPSRA